MERLIIELFTWLFENLFGNQEKSAQVGPRENEDPDSPKRGPYNYGAGGNKPQGKTLAELLEEVRQQNAGGSRAAPPPPPPSPPPPPPPRRPTQIIKPAQAAPVAAAPVYKEQPAQPPKLEKKKKKRKQQNAVTEVQEIQSLHAIRAIATPGKGLKDGRTGVAPALQLWLDGTRNASQPQRKLLQAQAIVAMEVFGPPRSRRPHMGRKF